MLQRKKRYQNEEVETKTTLDKTEISTFLSSLTVLDQNGVEYRNDCYNEDLRMSKVDRSYHNNQNRRSMFMSKIKCLFV